MNKRPCTVTYPWFNMVGKSQWKPLSEKTKSYSCEQQAKREINAEINYREKEIVKHLQEIENLNTDPEKSFPMIGIRGPAKRKKTIKELLTERKEFVKLYKKDIAILKGLQIIVLK